MEFSHCDHNEDYFILHDCIPQQAYFQNCKLGFEFNNGFGVMPDHPENHFCEVARTDFSKVEYSLLDGDEYDVTVYVFEKTFFGKIIRKKWKIQKLIDGINNSKCQLEFLYRYSQGNGFNIFKCMLKFNNKRIPKECWMEITSLDVKYYWNKIYRDRT